MKVYVDTNVLVAASVQAHPHHARAFELVSSIKNGAVQGCISTHGLAEFYAVLTRAPFSPRVHSAEVSRFLEDNIVPHFELVTLSADDYKQVLSGSAMAGLVGGIVYDALHLECARKAGCDRIFTFNTKDFRALAPDLTNKISAP